MRPFPRLSTLILVLVSFAVGQTAEERIVVNQMVGQVEVRSSGTAAWRAARVGMPVKAGWDIRTYVESSADLMFAGGTILKIGENSVVTVAKAMAGATGSSTNVKVGTGQIWANVKKLTNAKSSFEFETPTAVASIRGTKLGIAVGSDGTSVDVYEGLVGVRRPGSTAETSVRPRQRAVVTRMSTKIRLEAFSDKGGQAAKNPFAADTAKVDTTKRDTTSLRGDTAGIKLSVTSPAPNAVVRDPSVTVKGTASPRAVVLVMGREAAVGPDGSFSVVVDLVPGTNMVPVNTVIGNRTRSLDLAVEYRPPLTITVSNVTDNMEVTVPDLTLEVETSAGARYSVNGKEGDAHVTLATGQNTITVRAWNEWNESVVRSYTIKYRKSGGMSITLTTPLEGASVTTPQIPVAGTTSPGARVMVNNTSVTVGAGGQFSTVVPIPDEPQDYSIEVIALLGDNEATAARTVTYRPAKVPLTLAVTTPAERQRITTQSVHITGKTSPGASVTINGRSATPTPQGIINSDIPVTEQQIGEFAVEITAADETGELTKTVNVEIDGNSPLVNTSKPTLTANGVGGPATRTGKVSVQVLDRTPEDQITIDVDVNGSIEESVVDPGTRVDVSLDEGKNDYSIKAFDRARNPSNVVQGLKFYYLPGPLTIKLMDPSSEQIDISDLAPMPRGVGSSKLKIEVEIDDGIGDVPETVKSCRVTGNGVSVLLKQEGNTYRYSGEITLQQRSTNTFTIQADDLAGNMATKQLTLNLR